MQYGQVKLGTRGKIKYPGVYYTNTELITMIKLLASLSYTGRDGILNSCSGYLKNKVLKWKKVSLKQDRLFVNYLSWHSMLCCLSCS